MTNLELLRTTLSGHHRATAALEDLSTATKLLDAAIRLSDRTRAQQYVLIAGSTYTEVIEAMRSLQLSETQHAALHHAVTELANRLRAYRERQPQDSLQSLS